MKIDRLITYNTKNLFYTFIIDGKQVNIAFSDTNMGPLYSGYIRILNEQLPTKTMVIHPDKSIPEHSVTLTEHIKAPNLAKFIHEHGGIYDDKKLLGLFEKTFKEKKIYTFPDWVYDKYFPNGDI